MTNLTELMTCCLFSLVYGHFICNFKLIIVPDKVELSAKRKISNHQSFSRYVKAT